MIRLFFCLMLSILLVQFAHAVDDQNANSNLTCPMAEHVSFMWSPPGTQNGWASGSLVNGYTIGEDTPMSIAITHKNRFPLQTNLVTLTMNLGLPAQGVGSVTFDILDIDEDAANDRLSVNGTLDGIAATPTITPLIPAGRNVTFTHPVDQIVLIYDNAPFLEANPSAYVTSLFANMAICKASLTKLSIVKRVEVSDPENTGLFMASGTEIHYKITVMKNASTAADDIEITDTLPDTLKFMSASTTGFTTGNFGNPALPPKNTDCASGACAIRYSGASLPANTTGEIIMRATIK